MPLLRPGEPLLQPNLSGGTKIYCQKTAFTSFILMKALLFKFLSSPDKVMPFVQRGPPLPLGTLLFILSFFAENAVIEEEVAKPHTECDEQRPISASSVASSVSLS